MPPTSSAEAALWEAIVARDPTATVRNMTATAEFDGPSVDAIVTSNENFEQRLQLLVTEFISRYGTGREVTTMVTLQPGHGIWMTCWAERRIEGEASRHSSGKTP